MWILVKQINILSTKYIASVICEPVHFTQTVISHETSASWWGLSSLFLFLPFSLLLKPILVDIIDCQEEIVHKTCFGKTDAMTLTIFAKPLALAATTVSTIVEILAVWPLTRWTSADVKSFAKIQETARRTLSIEDSGVGWGFNNLLNCFHDNNKQNPLSFRNQRALDRSVLHIAPSWTETNVTGSHIAGRIVNVAMLGVLLLSVQQTPFGNKDVTTLITFSKSLAQVATFVNTIVDILEVWTLTRWTSTDVRIFAKIQETTRISLRSFADSGAGWGSHNR